jgi:hypothetical protein
MATKWYEAPAGWEFFGSPLQLEFSGCRLLLHAGGNWTIRGTASLGTDTLRKRKFWKAGEAIPEGKVENPSAQSIPVEIASGEPSQFIHMHETLASSLADDAWARHGLEAQNFGGAIFYFSEPDAHEYNDGEYGASLFLPSDVFDRLRKQVQDRSLERIVVSVHTHNLLTPATRAPFGREEIEFCFPKGATQAIGQVSSVSLWLPALAMTPENEGTKEDFADTSPPPTAIFVQPQTNLSVRNMSTAKAIYGAAWLIALAIIAAAFIR